MYKPMNSGQEEKKIKTNTKNLFFQKQTNLGIDLSFGLGTQPPVNSTPSRDTSSYTVGVGISKLQRGGLKNQDRPREN